MKLKLAKEKDITKCLVHIIAEYDKLRWKAVSIRR